MDYREKAFKEKFDNASLYLGVEPEQIVSLKFRETVSSYSEYHKLLDVLQRELHISYQKIDGNFQGTGYLVTDTNSKVILVEHESGLELLYIAGSIASLLQLIPLIRQCWLGIRNHFDSHHHRGFRNIEIRKIDIKGRIKEDRVPEEEVFCTPLLPNSLIVSATQRIESEIDSLKNEIKALSERIKKVEKPSTRKTTIKKAVKK
ncbi:MAG: hypothetical protein AB1454_12775 [Candidatus Auribacterota bacterium]